MDHKIYNDNKLCNKCNLFLTVDTCIKNTYYCFSEKIFKICYKCPGCKSIISF